MINHGDVASLEVVAQIAVTEFPTYILYNRGREITRIRGAKSADELMNLWRRRL